MFSILALLIVLTLSILVTRIAAVALTHTGLTRETARFQARSAFTGVGFTTSESEKLVNHPVRRKILQILMLVGNAGIITAVSSLILSFIGDGNTLHLAWKVVIIVAGSIVLLGLASSKWVDRHLSNLISRALNRYTSLDVNDYASMLRLAGEYQITEMQVKPDGWLAGKQLADGQLTDEGIIVLGITRKDGTYIGAPKGDTKVQAHDLLILYGRSASLSKLDRRRQGAQGDRDHVLGVAEQEEIQQQEEIKDESAGGKEESTS
jgi:K+/H+ antiporter YhaU regulatory subunit KhtT